MGLKTFKPYTPTRRFHTVVDNSELTVDRPIKSLTEHKKRISGRDNYGHLTIWRRGGGHKRQYRVIDFKRNKIGIAAKVATVEYDPNRSARICLLHYVDGEKRYIIHPHGLVVGQPVISGPEADILVGNALPLRNIPVGTTVHNLELRPGKGGQLVRSAGGAAQVVARDEKYAQVRLSSGEIRIVDVNCYATIGQVGNLDHENVMLGKAGRTRWLGRRPTNRGVSMNPVDHPHGGGEGKTSGGRHPTTPWGQPTRGYKTRNNKLTDRFIVKRREKK